MAVAWWSVILELALLCSAARPAEDNGVIASGGASVTASGHLLKQHVTAPFDPSGEDSLDQPAIGISPSRPGVEDNFEVAGMAKKSPAGMAKRSPPGISKRNPPGVPLSDIVDEGPSEIEDASNEDAQNVPHGTDNGSEENHRDSELAQEHPSPQDEIAEHAEQNAAAEREQLSEQATQKKETALDDFIGTEKAGLSNAQYPGPAHYFSGFDDAYNSDIRGATVPIDQHAAEMKTMAVNFYKSLEKTGDIYGNANSVFNKMNSEANGVGTALRKESRDAAMGAVGAFDSMNKEKESEGSRAAAIDKMYEAQPLSEDQLLAAGRKAKESREYDLWQSDAVQARRPKVTLEELAKPEDNHLFNPNIPEPGPEQSPLQKSIDKEERVLKVEKEEASEDANPTMPRRVRTNAAEEEDLANAGLASENASPEPAMRNMAEVQSEVFPGMESEHQKREDRRASGSDRQTGVEDENWGAASHQRGPHANPALISNFDGDSSGL